jgi:hypothetical protein
VSLGYLEAKESENIWLSYLSPYKLVRKSPFVKNFNVKEGEYNIDSNRTRTEFSFKTALIDSYEKYPETVVSGLTKIGGILALVRLVTLGLFYLHRYLFEKHFKN